MRSVLPGVLAASLSFLPLLACQAGNSPGGVGGSGGAGGVGGAGGSTGGGGSSAGGAGGASAGGGAGGAGSGIDRDAGAIPDEQPFEADPPRPDAPPNPVNVRACNALHQGVAAPVAVTGQEVFSIEAPPIASDERVYRVTIPPKAGAASHVTFTAPAAGEYVMFTSASIAVPLTVFALDGELIDVRLRLRISECPEVNGRHSVQLGAAKYVVRLGPERLPSVDLVVMPAAP
jgi:hypothetical protein